MKRAAFEALVNEAFRSIPRAFRDRLRNVAIMVEDEPEPWLLDEMGLGPGETLFGLYQGTPVPRRDWAYGNQLPDRIVLYQRPIEDASDDEDEMFATIAETLIHEAGHYFGLSEEEIQAIEDEYWSDAASDDDAGAGPDDGEGT